MHDRVPGWLHKARTQWTNTGAERPDFAIDPAEGQESVWDYPRPPALDPVGQQVEVVGSNGVIASSDRSLRVLETSHPPSYYVPGDSLDRSKLVTLKTQSHCEWKGTATYFAEPGSDVAVGWTYNSPYPEFGEWAGWVSFYPGRVRCLVDGHVAEAQPGNVYGGWITPDVVGPFKGDPGTGHW